MDDVLRATYSLTFKAVTCLKSRKIGFDTFLVQTKDGVMDTILKATVASTGKATQNENPETFGTIEMRIYMLRKFGEEHNVSDKSAWYIQNKDSDRKVVNYKLIEPDLKMVFEKDCATLNQRAAKDKKSKANGPRPGKAPWVVFRFHCRSKGIRSGGLCLQLVRTDVDWI